MQHFQMALRTAICGTVVDGDGVHAEEHGRMGWAWCMRRRRWLPLQLCTLRPATPEPRRLLVYSQRYEVESMDFMKCHFIALAVSEGCQTKMPISCTFSSKKCRSREAQPKPELLFMVAQPPVHPFMYCMLYIHAIYTCYMYTCYIYTYVY